MPDFLWLAAAALCVGVLIGAVGIGGILLIPALTAFAGLDIHTAMATALFTFIFTGITGSILFQRHGSIDWRLTVPVCAGALPFAFAGAWANAKSPDQVLGGILAGLIIFAGFYTLAAWRGPGKTTFSAKPGAQRALLGCIGATAGFGSGLTGVGGPALSVPLMVLFGFPALASIGTSQVIQIIAATSGTFGNLHYGHIDFRIAATVTLLEIAGVFIGVRIVHAVNADILRRFVAILCIGVGIFLIKRLFEQQ